MSFIAGIGHELLRMEIASSNNHQTFVLKGEIL
jgi:hypothetical protein